MSESSAESPLLSRQGAAWRFGTYRWTISGELDRATIPLVHDENIPMIRALAAEAEAIILATGSLPRSLRSTGHELFTALKRDGRTVLCLGTLRDGSPRHPSRIRYNTPFSEFVL
jgi:hypothetical protein